MNIITTEEISHNSPNAINEPDQNSENTSAADIESPIDRLSTEQDSDIFLFSGTIDRPNADKLINKCNHNVKHKNVSLIICTYGGDGDAAYIIAKYLKNRYKTFRLYVFGFCKSAGTLLALGADEIIMSITGELGPLDVQILREDALSPRGSGLDLINAISAIRTFSFEYFSDHLLQLKENSGYTISTRIAADIASTMAIGLFSPIMNQIDPVKLGEIQRSMNIAYEYGKRLAKSEDTIRKLTTDYPSHSFVIDFDEAKELLPNVRLANDLENEIDEFLSLACISKYNVNIIHQPEREIIRKLSDMKKKEDNNEPKNDCSQIGSDSITESTETGPVNSK